MITRVGHPGRAVEACLAATATHEIASQHLSAKKAHKLLGWAPRWTLQSALAEAVAWYRAYLTSAP